MMKKLFTSLLLLTALLCFSTVKAQPQAEPQTICSNSDFEIIKISAQEYQVISKNQSGASIYDMNGYTFTPAPEKNAFLNCNGKISIIGNFQNLGGLNNLKFSNVNLKEFTGQSFKIKDRSWSNLTTLVLSDTWNNLDALSDLTEGVTDLTIGLNVTTIPADKIKLNACLKTLRFADAANAPGLKIESKAFKSFTVLETIEWPTRLTDIGEQVIGEAGTTEGAFDGCTALKSINLSNCTNLKVIGKDAFHNCSGVESVTLPTSLEIIGNEAFDSCNNPNFTTINLAGLTSLQAIGFEAFERCTYLENVTLPSGTNLKHFAHEVFKETAVESLDMSMCEGIEEFDFCGRNGNYRVFRGYSNLKYVSLPPNLKYLGNTFGFDQGVTFTDGTYPLEVVFNGAMANPTSEKWNSDGLVIGKDAFKANPALSKLTFVNNSNLKEIGQSAFQGCTNLGTVLLGGNAKYGDPDGCELINPLTIQEDAFHGVEKFDENNNSLGYSLDSVKLSNNVTLIGKKAFCETGIRTIHIPASVEEIQQQAFENCNNLTIVVFDEIAECNCGTSEQKAKGYATVVRGSEGSGAFNNAEQITDVYVNTTTPLICENNAFDPAITTGRGDTKANFGTLHFPEDELEHYVNTSHYLTNQIVLDPGLFHKWLMKHMDLAKTPPKGNGWWEFINAGPMKTNIEDEPTYQDIMLRTFSDYSISYIVPSGLRAYIVNGYNKVKDKNGNETGNYELTLQRLDVIPAGTGVILYGHPNGKNLEGKPILSMTPVSFAKEGDIVEIDGAQLKAGPNEGKPLCRDNWGFLTDADQEYMNYLEPTSTDPNNALHGGIHLEPYVKNAAGTAVEWRNFIMTRYKQTLYEGASATADDANYMGFFRVVRGDYPSGYAYLKMKYDEYNSASGSEIIVKEDKGIAVENQETGEVDYKDGYYYERYPDSPGLYDARKEIGKTNGLNPKGWWDTTKSFYWAEYTKSWGTRKFAANEVLTNNWEIEEGADGIAKLTIPADTNKNEYYTLQGVKVANPTKGVYISNGKKVIVK